MNFALVHSLTSVLILLQAISTGTKAAHPPPGPDYGHHIPNMVSNCSPSGVPVHVYPDIGVTLESPNYPASYEDGLYCVWDIIVDPQEHHSIQIHVNPPFEIPDGDLLLVNDTLKNDTTPMSMQVANFTIQLLSDYVSSGKKFSFFIHGLKDSPVSVQTTTHPVKQSGIYLFGGLHSDCDYSTSVYKINPDSRSIEVFNMSSPYRGKMQAGALANGSILFYSWDGPFNGYGLYNPSTNRVLSTLPNIPNIVFGGWHSSVIVTGSSFVHCGYNDTNDGVSPCVIYNTLNGGFKIANVRERKYGGCAVPFGDNRHILWIGGSTLSVIKLDTDSGTFSQVATMPQSRVGHSCALLGDVVVICEGWTNDTTFSCITLTLPSMTWSTFPSMTTQRADYQLVNWKGQLLAIGGRKYYNDHFNFLSSIELYNGHVWSQLTSLTLPNPLPFFGAGVVNTCSCNT